MGKTYPKLQNFNEMYTPPIAMKYIMPFLNKKLIYWECCFGKGHMANELKKNGFKVIGNRKINCLTSEPEVKYDFIITNPPFNGNKKFIKRAIELKKPFAFLIRLEHLGGVEACSLFKDLDFKLVIPEKRINFLTSKTLQREKTGGSPFHSIWFTYGLKFKKDINYIK